MSISRTAAAGLIGLTGAVFLGQSASAQDDAASPVTALDAVSVTATRTEKSALEAPASVSVVGREEIERAQPQALDDVLKGVPGVQMTGGPRNSAEQPSIRGFSDERVVIRTDGVRKNFQSGHRGRTFLEPTLLKQVDVLRGPSSMLYGSGALGGVINMETIDAADLLAPGETVGARTTTGYQTNNDMRRGGLTIYGRPADGVDLLVNGVRSSSGNYTDGSGDEILFSGDSVKSGLAKAEFTREGHSLDLSLQTYRNEHDIPTAANTDGDTIAERVTREDSGSVRYGFEGADGLLDLNAAAYVSDTDIREIVKTSGRHDVTALETVGVDAANTADFVLSDTVDLAFTAGLELYRDTQVGQRNDAPRDQFPNAEQVKQGYFAQAEFTLWDEVAITPGLRFDAYDQEATGQADAGDERLSKKLAASWQVSDALMLFGSYSEAFRAPSLTELYVSGTHFRNNRFVPNPDLKPEFAENKEFGAALSFDSVVQDRDALRIKGAVFRNDVENLIETVVEGGPFGTTETQNVPEGRITGAELEAAYEARRFFAGLAATRLRGDDLTDNEPLADIPEDVVSLDGGLRWPGLGLVAGWRASLYFGQDRVPDDAEPLRGRKMIHDLFVSYEPNDPDLDGLRVDFGVDNVFDKDFQRFGSALRETGRNVKLSAGFKF
ncbi:MAG: TonB-dependent hemoglobin/transferrin/lactoferrin family receptor [Marivibrio sp.]|uniref:TonB-dependent hemoglobin/transferrin/lactoferrin family receptor n=1 Tax=Marivibrio sp. TaxID=2039719 RepID=UPI0032ED68DF